MARHPEAWREPIPALLRGDEFPPPKLKEVYSADPRYPHIHTASQGRELLPGCPEQKFPRFDMRIMRERQAQARQVKRSAGLSDIQAKPMLDLQDLEELNPEMIEAHLMEQSLD